MTPPREFLFMDRAALGPGGVFHLGAELNFHRLVRDGGSKASGGRAFCTSGNLPRFAAANYFLRCSDSVARLAKIPSEA